MANESMLGSTVEERQSEQALRESEERYRRLFELCPDAVFVHCAGVMVLINSAGAKLLGAEHPEQLIGKPVLDFVHPDYRDVVRERMAALRQGGSVGLMEQQIIRLDGVVIDVEVTAGALVYHEQEAVQVIARDIRKRKRLEFQNAQITQLSDRLNSAITPKEAAQIIAATADVLLGWDACTLHLYSAEQDKMSALLTMDEIDGQHRDVAPINDGGAPTFFDRRVLREGGFLILRDGAAQEKFSLTPFGNINRPSASMLFAPIRNRDQVSGIVSLHSYTKGAYTAEDLALLQFLADHGSGALERLRAQEALRESEERFHAFMEHSPVVAYIKNESGQYLYANAAWARTVNRSPAELLGKTDFDLWPEAVARQLRRNDAAAFDSTKPLETIQSIPGPGASLRSWMLLTFLIHSADGNRLLGGLALDMTERKQAEEELSRSRGELRSLAAHLQSVREEERIRLAREIHDELGQLLTGFKMDLSWLDKRFAGFSDENLRPRLVEKVKSMSALVDDMVDSVRRISAELRPGLLDDLGLVAAMEWHLREFEKRAGLHCRFESGLEASQLPAELCTGVFRIFQEALTNIARHADAAHVSVSLETIGGQLILRIEDDGRGITDQQSAGPKSLGVAGMRERAMVLGGDFTIKSTCAPGTLVSVAIPLRSAAG